jgi:hypothetical protein
VHIHQLRAPIAATVQHHTDLDLDPRRHTGQGCVKAAQTRTNAGLLVMSGDHHADRVDHSYLSTQYAPSARGIDLLRVLLANGMAIRRVGQLP